MQKCRIGIPRFIFFWSRALVGSILREYVYFTKAEDYAEQINLISRFQVFILFSEGSVYILCPVAPFGGYYLNPFGRCLFCGFCLVLLLDFTRLEWEVLFTGNVIVLCSAVSLVCLSSRRFMKMPLTLNANHSTRKPPAIANGPSPG